ncbi:MAG: leucine-rich repeat domain-containing protein [Verrucomicrobia bacterium]|nr:leucine-rich repeat domain-containing protein [Verrucomicrobiota bacterium]
MAAFPPISGTNYFHDHGNLFNLLLQTNSDNQLRLMGWENLKQRAPIGPLNIPKMMQQIEQQLVRSGNSLADDINLLFAQFTHALRPMVVATLLPGEKFQVTEADLITLQARLEKHYEDEALQKIWNQKLLPIFREQGAFQHVPLPHRVEEIRAWLNTPANQHMIQQVTELNLISLQLKTLPSEIGLFTGLQRLDLSYNRLNSLPDSIGNLNALTHLYLAGNQLSSLPESIGNLSALTRLDLSCNQLSSLPDSIGNLSALTGLSVSTNQLSFLPDSIGNLRALSWLNLPSNQLSSLPDSIGNLRALSWLNLSFNQLSFLPEPVGNLLALTRLDLSYNQLSSPPDSIGNLRALSWLNLESNELSFLPESIGNLRALTRLSLSYNQLSFLPESIGNLSALRELYLTDNPFMLVSDNGRDKIRNYQAYLALLESQKKYIPQSPLAILFQAIISNKPVEEIQQAYGLLSPEMQQRIADLAGRDLNAPRSAQPTAASSSSAPSPVQESLFTDVGLFARSVRKAAYALYGSLEPEKKKSVHWHIWDLAGRPATNDSNWGEHHVFDHVLRFTDALERATQN